MSATLREVARELTRIATDLRDVASRVDGVDSARFAAARDIRAVATDLEHRAGHAERIGLALREPDPDDALVAVIAGTDPRDQWPLDHEYAE